jgi:hypothetical protein
MSIPPIPRWSSRPITPGCARSHASFWLSLLLTVYFVMQGCCCGRCHLPIWHLVEREVQDQHLHSLTWLLAHPVAASMIAALLCLASTLASWGLLRERSWGLWSFVAILLLSALANFAIAGWLDVFMRDVIRCSPTTPSCGRSCI